MVCAIDTSISFLLHNRTVARPTSYYICVKYADAGITLAHYTVQHTTTNYCL